MLGAPRGGFVFIPVGTDGILDPERPIERVASGGLWVGLIRGEDENGDPTGHSEFSTASLFN